MCGHLPSCTRSDGIAASSIVPAVHVADRRQVNGTLGVDLVVGVIGEHRVIQGCQQLRVHVTGVAWLHELRHDVVKGQLFVWVSGQKAQHEARQAFWVGAVGHARTSATEVRNCEPCTTGKGQQAVSRTCWALMASSRSGLSCRRTSNI